MGTDIVDEILGYRWFIISELAVGILFIIAMFILTRKFGWKGWKVRTFGSFFNLDDRMIWAIALLFTRYIFVVSAVIFRTTMGISQLALLLALAIIFNLVRLDIPGLLVDTVTYGVVFGALVVCNMFDRYMDRVGGDTQILIVSGFMGLFIVLHSTYYTLVTFQKIMAGGENKDPAREREALVIIRKKLGIKEKAERAAIRAARKAEKAQQIKTAMGRGKGKTGEEIG